MKYHFYKTLFSLIFLIAGFSGQVKGTHIMGSDITWKCLGNDSFEVTVSVYRDCTGINLGTPSLNTVCKSGGSISKNPTQKGSKTVTDVTPTCESSCTQCSSSGCSFQYGIEKHEVTYIVDLSNTSCCKVGLRYSGCCRSNSITTGLAHDQFFVESWMNRCKAPCNNSPTFKEPPIGMLCKDQKFIYNQGASDDDTDSTGSLLDSLSYSFARPLGNGPGDYLSYKSPYGYKEPLKYKGFPGNAGLPFPFGFHLDEVTGDLKFTPTKEQVSVMAFKIDEFRDTDGDGKKDDKISQIRRDLQFFVIKCPNNNAPTVTGMKCPNNDFYEEICAGTQSTFNFCTNDKNPKDSVTINFNRGNLPGSPQWIVKNPNVKHQSGKLKWTPKDKHASQIPYQFTVSAVDDNCPVNARTVQSYRLKVKPIPRATFKHVYKKCGKFNFSAQKVKGKGMSFTWRGEGGIYSQRRNFRHKFQEPGKYPYKLTISANGCQNVYYDTIKLDPFLRVDIGNDTTMCQGSTIKLGGKAKDANGPVTYTWHDSVTGTTSRTFKNLQKDTVLSLTVTDTVCSYTDSVEINIRKDPEIKLGTDPRICAEDTVSLKPALRSSNDTAYPAPWVYLDEGWQEADYKWFKDQVSGSPFSTSDSIEVTQGGDVILQAADSIGCANTDTIQVKTNPELKPEARPKEICYGDTSTLKANKTGGKNITYTWTNLRTNNSFTGKNVDVYPDTTTTYALVVEETTKGVYCRDSATTKVKVEPLPEIQLSSIPNVCSNADTVGLNQYANYSTGKWKTLSNTNAISNRKTFHPKRVKPGVYDLEYEYKDPATQCTNSDITSIRVLDLPKVDAGMDTVLCTHEGRYELNPSPVTNQGSSSWNGVGVTETSPNKWHFDPNAQNVSQGSQLLVYSYTEPAPDKCTNRDTLKVTVQNSPRPTIGNQEGCIDKKEVDLSSISDQVSWYGKHVQGKFFNTPNSPGNYDVSYAKTNNVFRECKIKDTINFKVNDTPAVTASTRSGDTRFCENKPSINLYGTQSVGSSNAGNWTLTTSGTLNGTSFSPEQNGPGEYEFVYEYTDPRTQCSNSESLNITVDKLPEVSLQTNNNVKCIGQKYRLEASFDHADRVTWTSNGRADEAGFSNIKTGSGITSAAYEPNRSQKDAEEFWIYIRADNDGICKPVKDSIYVQLKPEPRPDFSAPRAGCPPFSTQFENESSISKGGEIVSYTWKFGDGQKSKLADPLHQYKEPGEYTVQLIAESKGGCRNQITKNNYIEVYQPPDPHFTADPTYTTISTSIVEFTNKTKFTDGQTKYFWHFDDDGYPNGGTSTKTNPTHQFSDTGLYDITLVAQGANDCKDTTIRENYIEIDPNIIVYAPNAFSPDDDGKNDVYKVQADNFTNFEISIFNRWGERLYRATSYEKHREEGWDGTYKGKPVPSGAYMYVIKTTGLNGEEHTHSGTVNVIR